MMIPKQKLMDMEALCRALNAIAEAAIEALNAIDGDPDLETADRPDDEEAGDEEPSLGWTTCGALAATDHYFTDAELDNFNDEENGDLEPNLGWTVDGEMGETCIPSLDAELDDSDLEPSIGAIGYLINGKVECDLELDTSDFEIESIRFGGSEDHVAVE